MPSRAVVDATVALARLLADAGLRARFRAARGAVLDEMGVAAAGRAALLALDADDLDRQSAALIAKRAAEVARLLPRTFSRGGRELRERFERHAEGFWPHGHRRHLLDAAAFAERLADQGEHRVNRLELNRLRFILGGRRLAIHCFGELVARRGGRPGLQLLLATRRGGVREFRLSFGA